MLERSELVTGRDDGIQNNHKAIQTLQNPGLHLCNSIYM